MFGFCEQKGQLQLKFITEDETWVHQNCHETQAQSMALIATVFWDMHFVLLLHFSPPNETVNSAAYQTTLKKLKRAVQRKMPQVADNSVL